MCATDDIRQLYPRLIAGELAGVMLAFRDRATVDSPLGGKQAPMEWMTEQRAWLEEHGARCVEVNTVTGEAGVSHELMLWLTAEGTTFELPVLLVADLADGRIAHLRVYHSTLPLTGRRAPRRPLMEYREPAHLDALVSRFFAALGCGKGADAFFEPEGYVRESAGPDDSYRGDDRRRFFAGLLAGGGVRIMPGNVVDDGSTAVVEYLLARDDGRGPQAGAAAYTRAGSGRLLSARIYDDSQVGRGPRTRRRTTGGAGATSSAAGAGIAGAGTASAAAIARYSAIVRSTARAATRPLALDCTRPRVTPAPSPMA